MRATRGHDRFTTLAWSKPWHDQSEYSRCKTAVHALDPDEPRGEIRTLCGVRVPEPCNGIWYEDEGKPITCRTCRRSAQRRIKDGTIETKLSAEEMNALRVIVKGTNEG